MHRHECVIIRRRRPSSLTYRFDVYFSINLQPSNIWFGFRPCTRTTTKRKWQLIPYGIFPITHYHLRISGRLEIQEIKLIDFSFSLSLFHTLHLQNRHGKRESTTFGCRKHGVTSQNIIYFFWSNNMQLRSAAIVLIPCKLVKHSKINE